MLYAVTYQREFSSRQEELSLQRDLAGKLLRRAVRQEMGEKTPFPQMERTPLGKPYFVDCPLQFSLSHCKGLVCCALSLSPVGVDAESPRPFGRRLVERVCTREELSWLDAQPDAQTAFLSLWTLKESVMKLSGQGMAYGFQRAAFTFQGTVPHFQEEDLKLSQFTLAGGWVVSAVSRQETFSHLQMVQNL